MRHTTGSAAHSVYPDHLIKGAAKRGVFGHRLRRPRLGARHLPSAGLACALVLLAGCKPPTESVQWGFRGNSMIQVYNPTNVSALGERNLLPDPEPSDPYDPTFPMATEVHENVQVLTDLNALEFARLMNAMTTWVAPDAGCAYCHNPENLAEDSKYTKLVSRQMLKMTRDINANWESHVADTGVTCWTCHRGEPVPSDIWFEKPDPPRPSAGTTGWKGGQNLAGVANSGFSSLPYDPLTPFLLEDNEIRVQGTNELPHGNRQSIKQAEYTYSLMMYMSNALGVNCTYCHQTRAMGVWEESTPQRVTAWHGIRMVREINNEHLNPLQPLYPEERLGSLGDAPKAACGTCHKGSYKPLYGQTMLADYPSMRGVLPGRLSPDPTEGGVINVAWAPEGAVPASVDERTLFTEMLAAAAAERLAEQEAIAEQEAEIARAEAAAAAEAIAAAEAAAAVQAAAADAQQPSAADTGLADAGRGEPTDIGASAQAASAAGAARRPFLSPLFFWQEPERVAKLTDIVQVFAPTASSTSTRVDATQAESGRVVAAATAEQPLAIEDMTMAEIEAALTGLMDRLRGVREELETASAADATPESPQATDDTALDAQPAVDPETEQAVEDEAAPPEPPAATATAAADADGAAEDGAPAEPESDLEALADSGAVTSDADTALVEAQSDATAAHAEALAIEVEDLRAELDAKDEALAGGAATAESLDAAQAHIAAMQARLDQETTALAQQLEVVRRQRDAVDKAQREEHADAMDAAAARLTAMQARIDQQRTALNQQLEVVRGQRDVALAEAETRVAQDEHAAVIAGAERQLDAIAARLDQQTHALGQQLRVVRSQRDAAHAQVATHIPPDQHHDAVDSLQNRVAALQARLDQNRHALEQQLDVVRSQRDGMMATAEARIAALEREHADALEALHTRIAAGDARQEQEREALRQQLAVVREQRDAAKAAADREIGHLNERLAETQAQLGEVHATAAQAQALTEMAEAMGGRVTDEGVVINLGGDRLSFASGSATLPAGDLPDLDRMAAYLADRPELQVRIEGHTDSVGSPALNQSLSQQRAKAVMAALAERGVEAARLSAEGMGPDRPIASNATIDGRGRNRRVEVYIIANEQVASGVAD